MIVNYCLGCFSSFVQIVCVCVWLKADELLMFVYYYFDGVSLFD